jgi:hypothetical protein
MCGGAGPWTCSWARSDAGTGYGHIEIGDQEMFGFVARALDSGGLVFEDNKAWTLAEALASLERGLAKYFKREGTELEE